MLDGIQCCAAQRSAAAERRSAEGELLHTVQLPAPTLTAAPLHSTMLLLLRSYSRFRALRKQDLPRVPLFLTLVNSIWRGVPPFLS